MKRIIIVIALLSLIGCFNKPNKVTIEIYKKSIIKSYNNVPENNEIISEQEAIEGVFNSLTNQYKTDFLETLKINPEWKNASLGDLILVEDYYYKDKFMGEFHKYYYFVTGKINSGEIIAEGIIRAMKKFKGVGEVGSVSISNKNAIKKRLISKQETLNFIKRKYKLNNITEIKAILINKNNQNIYNWNWIIKNENKVKIRSLSGDLVETKYILIDPRVYDINKLKKRNNLDFIKNKIKIWAVNNELFESSKRNSNLNDLLIPVERHLK